MYVTQQIFVPESQIDFHLTHGDIEGFCETDDAEARTITVDARYLVAHFDHGDGIGECVDVCHQFPPLIIDYGSEPSECQGAVANLTLKYLGNEEARVLIKQQDEYIAFNQVVQPGEEFTIIGTYSATLSSDIRIFTNLPGNEGDQYDGFHTSCSEPIGIDSTSGKFRVVAGQSTIGGPLCNVNFCVNEDGSSGGEPTIGSHDHEHSYGHGHSHDSDDDNGNNGDQSDQHTEVHSHMHDHSTLVDDDDGDDDDKKIRGGKYSCLGKHKVNICHVPPGNTENAHNICIAAAALQAHLAHGDILGGCTQEVNADERFTVTINPENVEEHQDHGDFMDLCELILTVCHEGVTTEIAQYDWEQHDAHFDYIGACQEDLYMNICHEDTNVSITRDEWLSDHRLHGDTQGSCPTSPGVCNSCSGKISELSFKYIGQSRSVIKVLQAINEVTLFEQVVEPGDQFSVFGNYNGSMDKEIIIYVAGEENTKIHTSCSKPVGPGLITGDFEVVTGLSKDNGSLCELPDCLDCSGKVTDLTLKFNSLDGANVKVEQKKDNVIVFDQFVAAGGQFSVSGTDNGTLGTEVYFYVNDSKVSELHTSCSKVIGIGTTAGNFEVIAGNSLNNGPLCEHYGEQDGSTGDDDDDDSNPPPPGTCQECSGKVSDMIMQYNGSSEAVVSVIQKKDNITIYSQTTSPGVSFNIVGTDNGTLSTEVYFYIDGVLDGALHTSCSEPIGIGTTAGNFEVISGNSKNNGPLCSVPGEQ